MSKRNDSFSRPYRAIVFERKVLLTDGPLTIVDFQTYGRSDEWKENVLRNSAVARWKAPQLSKGKHTMHIYRVDPGVVLDRIVMNLGGL